MVLPPKKKQFDIKKHLEDHAYLFKQFKEINHDDIHFNFSFLDIQFFDKEKSPQEILEELLKELMKPAQYKMRNGWRVLKDGTKNQKWTTRKINLSEIVKIVAIHIKGASGEYTMPHIHLILDKNARLEKNFLLLKKHISEVSRKFGLKPNFEEVTANNPIAYRNLGKAVKNFSWIIRKMPNDEFKSYVNKPNFINNLRRLREYTLLSNNLQYYVKTMNYIRKRLQNLKMDKIIMSAGKKFNLKENYPLPITEQDKKVIELIVEKKFSQKDLKPHLKNAILRDFVRYSYFKDKKKALIIKELTEQTMLLPNIRPNLKALNNYLKLYEKYELPLDRSEAIKENLKKKEAESIKEILKHDLLAVAKMCKNEKELRLEMQKLGYIGFGFKKKSGKIFAYQFIPKNEDKKIVVKCSDTIAISEIRAILKENNLKAQIEKQEIKSKITEYKLPLDIRPQVKLLPVLYKKDLEIIKDIQKEAQKLNNQVKTLPKPPQPQPVKEVTFKLNLPELSLNVAIPTTIKQNLKERVKDAKEIRENIRTITDYTKQLEELSRRKLEIKRESGSLGEESQSFGKRIAKKISGTISYTFEKFSFAFAKAISGTIRNTIKTIGERFKKRIRNYLETKPRILSDNEKIAILKEIEANLDYNWLVNQEQINKAILKKAKEFGIDENFTYEWLWNKDKFENNLDLGFKVKNGFK